jgi:hypothetical protein
MPDAPRTDRLSRPELQALQRRALRSWAESDFLATHHPRQWQQVADQDPDYVQVELGAGVGEQNQTPGWIAVVSPETMAATPGMPAPNADGQRQRPPDFRWDVADGLPFEDATVDALRLRDHPLTPFVEREIARTLVLGGTLAGVTDADALEHFADLGLEPEGDAGLLRKVRGRSLMPGTSPFREREQVLGTLTIREPRTPSPG